MLKTNDCTKPIANLKHYPKKDEIPAPDLYLVSTIANRKLDTLIAYKVYTYNEIWDTDSEGNESYTEIAQDIFNEEHDEIWNLIGDESGWSEDV